MKSFADAPIEIIQGDSFERIITVSIKNCDTNEETITNLSSVVGISGEIINYDGSNVINLNTEIYNASAGQYRFWLTEVETATLSGTNPNKLTENIGKYWIEIE